MLKIHFKRIIALFIIFLGFSFSSVNEPIDHSCYLSKELLKPINQRLVNELSNFEYSNYIEKEVNRLLNIAELKGATLAIVKDEKLVYAQAFGYADYEKGIQASPENLFRIASVSKLITAIAIMQLVEEGRMSLDDKIFGAEGFFNDDKYLSLKDPKLKQISVRNLLDHTSGWTQRYGDPAFNPLAIAKIMNVEPPITVDTYIRYVISRRLQFSPGTVYSYSNMSYIFLGEIIARVTGMPYENYVRFNVLSPLGITDMHIGSSSLGGRLNNEVKYYEPEGALNVKSFNGNDDLVPKVYGGNDIELLGAAGGWIASAPELARLMVSIDGFQGVADILTANSVNQMTEPDGNPLGWKEITSNGYWYRTGNYAGTTAMLCRRPDGYQWVFIANSSSWKGSLFSHDINSLMNRILRKVEVWPTQDLFNYISSDQLCIHEQLSK